RHGCVRDDRSFRVGDSTLHGGGGLRQHRSANKQTDYQHEREEESDLFAKHENLQVERTIEGEWLKSACSNVSAAATPLRSVLFLNKVQKDDGAKGPIIQKPQASSKTPEKLDASLHQAVRKARNE